MAEARYSTMLRLLKPVTAGLGLAFFVTAFMDVPAPVRLVEDIPSVFEQGAVGDPQSRQVTERNVMKLGSPLSAVDGDADVELNPLAPLESTAAPVVTGTVNGTALEPVAAEGDPEI